MIPLAYFLSLGFILVFTHGHYDEHMVWVLAGIHGAFAVSVLCWKEQTITLPSRPQLLAAVFFLFTLFLAHDPELIYVLDEEGYQTLKWVCTALAACAAALLLTVGLEKKWWNRVLVYTLLFGCAGLLVAAYVLTIQCSPSPINDAWTINQAAIEYVLAGENPYTQPYVDIYDGALPHEPKMVYMPGWLIWAVLLSSPFEKGFDVRQSLIVAEVITALFVVLIARQRRYEWRGAILCALVWLAFPVSLFVVEQSWTDSFLIAVFAAAICAMLAQRYLLAGLLVGYAVGTKQYAVIAAAFMFAYILKTAGFRKFARSAVGATITVSALLLPFAIADWPTFHDLFIARFTEMIPRPSLSIPTFFAMRLPSPDDETLLSFFMPYALAGWAIIFAVMGWTLHKRTSFGPQRLFAAISLCYGVVFLTAKLAFCNYYYFFAFFLFLVFIFGLGRPSESKVEP